MTNFTNKGARESIQQALLELMTQKSFQKISITEIIQLAHVSRTTYYYHYYAQKDILDEILDNFIRQLQTYVSDCHLDVLSQSTIKQLSKCIIDCMYYNRFMLKTILSSDMEKEFRDKYHNFLEHHAINALSTSSLTRNIHNSSFEYFFSGHYHLMKSWLLDDCPTSCEEFYQTVNQISALFTN